MTTKAAVVFFLAVAALNAALTVAGVDPGTAVQTLWSGPR